MVTNRSLKDFSVRSISKNSASLQEFNPRNRFRENIGTLTNRFRASDEVNKDEPNRYQFRLNRRATVKVTLENEENAGFFDFLGTKKRVQAELLSQGNELRSTERLAPEDEEDFRIRLNPGTYTVKVTGRSENDLEYDLEIRLDGGEDDDDDDDDD
jgi:N-methylhydantoinase B/oxoprolinase/acetone carboxylase alpha subunit